MKINKKTLTELKEVFDNVFFGNENAMGYVEEFKGTASNSEYIIVQNLTPFEFYYIKTPKKKEVTFEWLMNKIEKKSNSVYKNLTTSFKKLITVEKNYSIYPTTYGIGVYVVYCGAKTKTDINNIEKFLKAKGIKFENEYSEAGWVYRFKISKSAENIQLIKGI